MTRREIALHESGHAVAFVVLGLPLEYASIRRGRTFAGRTVHAQIPMDIAAIRFGRVPQQTPALRADVERRVIATLAGELAARFLVSRSTRGL